MTSIDIQQRAVAAGGRILRWAATGMVVLAMWLSPEGASGATISVTSPSFRLRTAIPNPVVMEAGDTEEIAYSTRWDTPEASSVRLLEQDPSGTASTLLSASKTAEGVWPWSPTSPGIYVLTHAAGTTRTVRFRVDITLTVVFDACGGSPAQQTRICKVGQVFGSLPGTPVRQGYVFLGWYTSASGGSKVEAGTVVPNGLSILYAHWAKSQTVVFDPNGGTCPVSEKVYLVSGTYAALPTASRSWQVFLGWFTQREGGTQVTAADTVTTAASRTLYAHWTNRQVTTFSGNGGTPATQKTTNTMGYAYGTLPKVTWANHAFLGWFDAAAGGDRINTDSTVSLATKRTLYAHWTSNQVTTLRWNDGTANATTVTNTIGKAYGTLPSAPGRTGYAFTGWFTAADGGTKVMSTDKVPLAAARTLYAHWTTLQTVTFDANGGSCGVETKGCTIGQPYRNLPAAARAGYGFVGWFTAKGVQVVVGETVVPELATRTLYAHWTTLQTVTFDANGGNCGVETKGCTIGQPYRNLPEAARAGYAFVGWFTAKEKGEQVVGGETVVPELAMRRLYAHWTTLQTVTFDANGGNCGVETKGCTIGQPYRNLPTATKEGYAFVGWFTAKDKGVQVVMGETVVPEVATRTLYAHWTDKQVTTFLGNGGAPKTQTTTNTVTGHYGVFPTVTWANHVFLGWFDAVAGGKRVYTNSAVSLEPKRTLYAHWTSEQVTTFRWNDGTTNATTTTNAIGKAYGAMPALPGRTGYAFTGWFTKADGGGKVKATDKVPELAKRTLYAHWTTVQTVTFDAAGGNCGMETKGCTIGQPYRNLPVATKAGYAFVGWFTAKGVQVVMGETVVPELAERTLYAHWTTLQTVAFDANGGDCAMETKGCTIGQPYRNLPVATRTGYGFVGWFTARDKGEQVVMGETVVPELAAQRLYAHWTTLQTVAFDVNGGICKVETKGCTIGEPYRNLPVATKAGYAFAGWFTEKVKGEQVVVGKTVVPELATRTLYAHWTDKQVTTFLGNGGTPKTQTTTNTVTGHYGSLPTVSWANHAFLGWFDAATGGKRVYTNSTVNPETQRTLHAHWTSDQVTTFRRNDGTTNAATATNAIGKAYGTMPAVPGRTGYAFNGWFTKADGGSEVNSTDKVPELAKRTLYAHWTTLQTVTFDANGGDCAMETKGCTIGQPYRNLPMAARAGYGFVGWFTDKDKGVQIVVGETVVTEVAKRTLYAHWTTLQTVAFDANGGDCAMETKGCTIGQPYRNLPAATKAGYAFVGWFTAKDKGEQVVVGKTVVPELATRTLYAHWTDRQVTTFLGNGGAPKTQTTTNTVTAHYGAFPTVSWADHAFLGWYDAEVDGRRVYTNSTVSLESQRTLYAHWTTEQVTTFRRNDGTTNATTATNAIGKAYGTMPAVPGRTGYAFTGWFTKAEGGSEVKSTDKVPELAKRTLYAHWTTSQTVTFDANGGDCVVETKECPIGQPYRNLPPATRAGYAFVGWFTAAVGGGEVKSADKVAELATRTLYAHWTTLQTVTFDANGGNCGMETKGCTIGQPYRNLPVAARAGYGFVGWFTEKEKGMQIVVGETVVPEAAKQTLYARWTTLQTVTFDANGGTCAMETKGCTIGQPYRNLPVATKAGHVFVGWFTKKDKGEQVVTGKTVVPEVATRTLYAHWTDQQVTTFLGNGGAPKTQTTTNTIATHYGSFPTVSWANHAFLGWYDAEVDGRRVYTNSTVSLATQRTLYAHWTSDQVTTFRRNDGTTNATTATNAIGKAYGTMPAVPGRTGYAFTGWFTKAEGGSEVKSTDKVPELAKRTLYAHWTTLQTVTFDANEGTCAMKTKGCTIGQPYRNLPVATRAGYGFVGWFTEKDKGVQIAEGEAVVPEVQARTLYAHWTTLQKVTLDANKGTCGMETKGCTIGQPYRNLPVATRAGYAFVGWFTEKDKGEQVVVGKTVVPELATLTLYAHWTDRQVTVFKGNGGSPATQWTTNTIYAKYGNLPTATRSGHVLAGWFTAAEGGRRVYTNSTVTLAAERTLYAHWSDQQVVTFQGNGGTPSTQTTTNTIYAKYGSFPAVAWTNHVFLGWYTAANASDGKQVYTNSTVTLAGTRTLWAQWSNQQVVTFGGNGGTPDVQRTTNTMGKAYGTLPVPQRPGHVFLGWYTAEEGGTEVKGTDKVTAATARTLWAHWTDRQVTVFNGNGGSPATQRTTNTISSVYGELPEATRPGHVLVGWYTSADGGKRVYTNSTVTPATERTLFAHWTDQQVVTFKGNGGTPSAQKTTNTIYSAYGELPTAKRSGQALVGWFNAPEGGRQVYTNSTVTLAAERTLYAHWTDKQVTTFKGNGGMPATRKTTNTIYAVYGTMPVPTWSGHVFQGWYNAAEGGKRVYTNSTVTLAATRTLYAHWITERGFVIAALAVGMHGHTQADSGEEKAGNVCRLRLELSAGTEYAIQWTASLAGKWETMEHLTAETDGEVEVEIEVPGGEKGFLRLVAIEPAGEAD